MRRWATLRQNHRWALVYNLAAMPLAALGLVHPWLAAAGMSASSIAVVLNSLRIGCRRERAPTTEPGGADAPTGRGGMNALVIMIPLSLALVAGAVGVLLGGRQRSVRGPGDTRSSPLDDTNSDEPDA